MPVASVLRGIVIAELSGSIVRGSRVRRAARRSWVIAGCVVTLALAWAAPLQGQGAPSRGSWVGLWLGAGDGGRYSSGLEYAFSLEAGYWRGPHMIFVRRSGVMQPTSPGLADLGILYGWRVKTDTGYAYAAAGGSYVADSYNGTGGIPFEVGVKPRAAGVGFKFLGNINDRSSFWGVVASVHFGRSD